MMFSHTRACWPASRCIAENCTWVAQCQAAAAARGKQYRLVQYASALANSAGSAYSDSNTQLWMWVRCTAAARASVSEPERDACD